jgi:hypothetical protein
MKDFLLKPKGRKEWVRMSCKSNMLHKMLEKISKKGKK